MDQATVSKLSEIASGEYTVLTYESKKTLYGRTYMLSASPDNGVTVLWFWSNGYLNNYIDETCPKKKFKINILEGRVSIIGYSRVVRLS